MTPGHVLDDGLAAADDAVDEGRLADVRAADDGHDRHGARAGLGVERVVAALEQGAVLVAELEVLEPGAQRALDGRGVLGLRIVGSSVLIPPFSPTREGASVQRSGSCVTPRVSAATTSRTASTLSSKSRSEVSTSTTPSAASVKVGDVESSRSRRTTWSRVASTARVVGGAVQLGRAAAQPGLLGCREQHPHAGVRGDDRGDVAALGHDSPGLLGDRAP